MARVAVVGATGAVGREMLKLLDRSDVPELRVLPIASARSREVDLRAEEQVGLRMDPVRTIEEVDFHDVDVAFFAAGAELSRQWGEKVAGAGCLVIDNSSAFRQRDDVPLVVPQVNPHTLRSRPPANLVANPNCSTIQLVRVLHPLHRAAGLRRIILTTYQAASGGGLRGLAELAETSRHVLDGGSPQPPSKFGQPLAFNLVPQIGALDADGISHEERKLRREPEKIMELPGLRVSVTAVRAPIFHCHSEAVWAEFDAPLSKSAAEEVLAGTRGLLLYTSADDPPYPTPRLVERSGSARAWVHVGRIRVDPEDPHALWMWIIADNLWVGAALNAVEIFETAMNYGWLDR